jgi:hypothetical protein
MVMLRLVTASLLLAPALLLAQGTSEALKGPDRAAYQDMKSLKNPVIVDGDDAATQANRALLAKQAKHIVSQLTDPKRIQMDDLARVIEEAILTDLPVPRGAAIKEYDKYLAFGKEMGAALVAELEGATKHPKIVVRVNAARMLSVVGELGYDKAAELALKIIAKPDESEGVKHWALRTLGNLFAIEPDSANKDVTVFTHFKNRDLENKCIVALCDYITTSRDVSNMSPGEIAGLTMIRREAVKALGHVRTPRLKFQGKAIAWPALVLLRVANKDGIVPEPDMQERVDAVVGFCRLFPVIKTNADRQVQCDFAADALGKAILDIATVKINNAPDSTIKWKMAGHEIDFALDQWAKNVDDMRLNGTVPAAKDLQKQIKTALLDWLKAGDPSIQPNAVGFRQWLQNNPPKSEVLFADEPKATMKPIGN